MTLTSKNNHDKEDILDGLKLKKQSPEFNFLEKICSTRKKGYGCVPLIGAGLSAPSGVPIINELHGYLHKCIAMALGLNLPGAIKLNIDGDSEFDFDAIQKQRKYRWLPERDDWPPFGMSESDGINWSTRIKNALDQVIANNKINGSVFSEQKVMQEGYGATAEWRSALLFLSRLRFDNETNKLILEPPDLDIVDTFFLRVVSQKKPTLGHYMLALLSGPLRITTVLTTNFDSLIENAFDLTFNEFTVFDVHVESGIPSYRDMQGQNSLVKLHGGRYGLRADYSLDQPPSDDDLRHFCSYLADRHITPKMWKDVFRKRSTENIHISASRYLLIIGSSVSDTRIISMITAAAEVLENFKVFWICGRKQTIKSIEEVLEKIFEKSTSNINERPYEVINHQYPGLFFLELFQRLTRGLPPRGCIFPSPPRTPVPPEYTLKDSQKYYPAKSIQKVLKNDLKKCIDNCFKEKLDRELLRFILMHGEQGKFFGAITVVSELFFQEIDSPRQAIWIDLDEIRDCNSLFEVMLHTISKKAGVSDWIPVLLHSDPSDKRRITDAQINEIARLTNCPDREWIIFLNARSGAGSVDTDYSTASPNGWLDQIKRDEAFPQITANAPSFWELLSRVCGYECPNITVVLLCYNGRFLQTTNRIMEFCNWDDEIPYPLVVHKDRIIKIEESIIEKNTNQLPFDFNKIVDDAIVWADTQPKRRFLLCLSLVNRMRYVSMVWSWPFHLENLPSEKLCEMADNWLAELEYLRVVRRKKGGFIWLHCDVRNNLRSSITQSFPYLKGQSATIHLGLAEWYHRLLASSNDPMIVFEVIYHRIKEALALIDTKKIDGVKDNIYRNTIVCLKDIHRVLTSARTDILSWGFSKGICHELFTLRNTYLTQLFDHLKESDIIPNEVTNIRESIFTIWELSLRINRDLAREVGENMVAISRHYQLRIAQYARSNFPDNYFEIISEYEKNILSTNSLPSLSVFVKILKPHKSTAGHENVPEWISSWNNLAILGIAIRSFAFSKRCFKMIYKKMSFPIELLSSYDPIYDKSTSVDSLKDWINHFLNNEISKYENRPAIFRAIVKTLQREQQLALACGHLFHSLSRRVTEKNDREAMDRKAKSSFDRASRAFEIAQVIQKALAPDGWPDHAPSTSLNTIEVSEWYDDRQRLLTQEGLVVAFKGDYRKAHRRLNEAEAALSQTNHSAGGMEQAIVELHRAEVLTHEAVFVLQDSNTKNNENSNQLIFPFDNENSSALGSFRSCIINEIIRQKTPDFAKLEEECRLNARPSEDLLSSMLCVEDGWHTLDRANEMLKANRKNVWWTTWYYELRMKLVEVNVFAKLNTIVEESIRNEDTSIGDTKIPYIGLEDAPFDTPTIADRILEDSNRIVRLDLFRYGRILESYANTTIAFALWRSFNGLSSTRDLTRYRLLKMNENIEIALDGLIIRLRRRAELDGKWTGTRLQADFEKSITFVQQQVTKILKLISCTLQYLE